MITCPNCADELGTNPNCPICGRHEAAEAGQDVIMDDEDALSAQMRAEARSRTLQFLDGIFAVIKEFRGSSGFAVDCACLAMGRTHLLGPANTQSLLGRKWNCSKANVQKLVDKFQEINRILPMPGQRGQSGRDKMSSRRKSQLKPSIQTKP